MAWSDQWGWGEQDICYVCGEDKCIQDFEWKHKGKPPLETQRWEDTTINLIDGMDRIHVAQYKDKLKAVLNMALNLWVSYNAFHFFTSWQLLASQEWVCYMVLVIWRKPELKIIIRSHKTGENICCTNTLTILHTYCKLKNINLKQHHTKIRHIQQNELKQIYINCATKIYQLQLNSLN